VKAGAFSSKKQKQHNEEYCDTIDHFCHGYQRGLTAC
jgi:hypothetical protein